MIVSRLEALDAALSLPVSPQANLPAILAVCALLGGVEQRPFLGGLVSVRSNESLAMVTGFNSKSACVTVQTLQNGVAYTSSVATLKLGEVNAVESVNFPFEMLSSSFSTSCSELLTRLVHSAIVRVAEPDQGSCGLLTRLFALRAVSHFLTSVPDLPQLLCDKPLLSLPSYSSLLQQLVSTAVLPNPLRPTFTSYEIAWTSVCLEQYLLSSLRHTPEEATEESVSLKPPSHPATEAVAAKHATHPNVDCTSRAKSSVNKKSESSFMGKGYKSACVAALMRNQAKTTASCTAGLVAASQRNGILCSAHICCGTLFGRILHFGIESAQR